MINTYCEFEPRSWRGVLDATLCDLRQIGSWFPPVTPVSSTNKTDLHDITEILLKVALSIITLTLSQITDTRWAHAG